ncbi:MAG: 4-hydroxythreonine-4-phosphate dehydrogenase PdxA [Gemmatimonadota bacterium]|nr:4-hydroxythreonine-4-phosphate dehydrogenase PdxA [Gemmatimonadota bacterium]
MTPRPMLGITMGDVCGIGPEVIVKALSHRNVYAFCRPLVIGDAGVLSASLPHSSRRLEVRSVDGPESGEYRFGRIDIWAPIDVDLARIETGRVCPEAGRAAVEWVVRAADLAAAGRIDGIVTAPLNKEAMNRAGFPFAGHTELLADRLGVADVRLMLASDRLNVAHVTGHVALEQVPGRLTEAQVFDTIRLLYNALEDMGRPDPGIAVCGLNPHAGEAGILGREDAELIRPAVQVANAEGMRAAGPLPADTVFLKAYNGDFDGVVAMYHDQGHAPVKLVAFHDAVNVTLGLPIVRVSVDHGTAFDIAGKGVANEANMLSTLRMGARLAGRKRAKSDAVE